MSPFRASAPLTDSWRHFELTVGDGIATLRLNRPDKLNALTFSAYADLRDLIGELPSRGDVRVLVITGQGRGFCSGGDVEEIIGPLQEMATAELLEFTRMTGAVVKALRESPVPAIAAINGVAAGAGAVLALACDFRLMAESASFAFLFTRVGLAGADMGSAYLLPRIVGLGRATELLLLGDKVDARRCREIGLAHEVVDDALLADRATSLARRLAQGPAFAYSTTKALLTRELDMALGPAIEMEAVTQALLMNSEDFEEFYAAWSDGRAPRWRGR
ncbi:MAG TPA: enoyl-CoA hydratase family protein [Solirubrobacteraceae bacterium]|nr:enoyl-CoA hydratase family protein [Solirubrobacteraceae bacterium]